MVEAVDAEAFQQRLWDMFPHSFGRAISLPQLDRIRWILFPEVRVPQQQNLFGDDGGRTRKSCPTSCASWTCSRSNWRAAWATATASSTAWRARARP
jgi:hypothetical protein